MKRAVVAKAVLKEVEIDFTNKQFMAIAKMAHDMDITFNEMCNIILRERMDKEEETLKDDTSRRPTKKKSRPNKSL